MKVFRSSTERALEKLDNQWALGTSLGGLKFILPDFKTSLWSDVNWRSWPRCSGANDMGPDMLSAVYCAKYKENLRLNWVEWFDFCHGACRSLDDGFKAVGVYSFMVLMLVPFNMPFGTDREPGMRWAQIMEVLLDMTKKFTTKNFELFKARAHQIIREMGPLLGTVEDGVDPIDALWTYMKDLERYPVHGGVMTKTAELMGWMASANLFSPNGLCGVFFNRVHSTRNGNDHEPESCPQACRHPQKGNRNN